MHAQFGEMKNFLQNFSYLSCSYCYQVHGIPKTVMSNLLGMSLIHEVLVLSNFHIIIIHSVYYTMYYTCNHLHCIVVLLY